MREKRDTLLRALKANLDDDVPEFESFNQGSYSMHTASLSALRALYLLYRDLQSPEETAVLRRLVVGSHPPFRWQGWIDT